MGLYLYCVAPPDHPEPAAVAGIDGAPVHALDTAALRTWVSPFDAPPTASLEHVRAHNAVVEAATEVSTPLPMRFGQWFESEAELRAVLEERNERLTRGLERVRGAVEFGVRVLDPGATEEERAPDRSSGRAYMEGLARREEVAEASRRRGAQVAAALRTSLGELVRDQRVRPGGRDGLVAIVHLVARHDTGGYSTAVDTFAHRQPDLRFVRSGPWPPYGFAEDAS